MYLWHTCVLWVFKKEFIKKEIESRYCLYKELVDNVSNINNYDTSENIKKLNKELNIKLAS